nr:MAG TPA: leucine rich repeat protein [Caudoviricetes sp.]
MFSGLQSLNLYGNMVTMGMESRLQNCPLRALK